jgi:Uma2 family endonuclease
MVREPSGGAAEVVAGRVYGPLWHYVESRRLGWVTMSSQGFRLSTAPDRVLAPDTAFTSFARLPELPARGFFPCAPDFAVEVLSPEDTWAQVLEKCRTWSAHGVGVVWAVHPERRLAVVFRPAEAPIPCAESEHVSAEPVLPDFVLSVSSLFHGIRR